MKYVVVVGGTMSGIGKGTLMSSIGVLLRSRNLSCTAIKIDPYLNQDAGTMSPSEHGEVYVLDDGGEVDLDLGNYERFLNLRLSVEHSITAGKIFQRVFDNERVGIYLGKTVQMVPHVVDVTLDWITRLSTVPVDRDCRRNPEVCLLEIGGTVGDIESEIFMETLRQLKLKIGPDNFCLCHLSYVPCLSLNEQKSKPTQHSVKALLHRGLQPDMIFCRSDHELKAGTKEKIAFFTQVRVEDVISVHNTSDIYNVPLTLDSQDVAGTIMRKLKIDPNVDIPLPVLYSLDSWKRLCVDVKGVTVNIAIVGKYTGSIDSYMSVVSALRHSAMEADLVLKIKWIDSCELERLTDDYHKFFDGVEGVIVPGGFGDRGLDGKRIASTYCRENKVPYLGICLGMQMAIVDISRTFCPMASHEEICDGGSEEYMVIKAMEEFSGKHKKGSSMCLGSRLTFLEKGSLAHKLYDQKEHIRERHRHRCGVNLDFTERLEKANVVFSGKDESGRIINMVELKGHPFFLCTQFHPEFKSTPFRPSPPFLGLLLAAKGRLDSRLERNGGKLLSGLKYRSAVSDC